jgi:hypothetical protein
MGLQYVAHWPGIPCIVCTQSSPSAHWGIATKFWHGSPTLPAPLGKQA